MRSKRSAMTGAADLARICHRGIDRSIALAIAVTLFAGAMMFGAPNARAVESYDYEWDPSGIYTRSMREAPSRSYSDDSDDEFTPRRSSRSERRRQRGSRRSARSEQAAAPSSRRTRNRSRRGGTRVASLGPSPSVGLPSDSLSGGGSGKIVWNASSACLNSTLRGVIAVVAANYGQVRVNSTCRSRNHNRRVGGAPRSYHLTGDAADIRIFGNWRSARSYLASAVGGFKHYGGGLFHIDTGPRRRF